MNRCSSLSPASRTALIRSFAMNRHASTRAGLPDGQAQRRFEVRSVTGACYTLVEEDGVDDASGAGQRRYRTAFAGLPVVANGDGSFTIVDTHTRLVRVDSR
jgi:hypothetical protein